MSIAYEFVPMGYVAKPEQGKIYVDVGNAFCSGILDHHHPDAPDACTAILVLNHPENITSQIADGKLAIIPHQYPDLDAVTGAYFARMHANGESTCSMHHDWAKYVCRIDQGFTTLTPDQPVTPYSLFMMRTHLLKESLPDDAMAASRMILDASFDFLEVIFDWLNKSGNLDAPQDLANLHAFAAEVSAIAYDLEKYKQDMQRAEVFACQLPKADGKGKKEVIGLWLGFPESAMFKSWARGDVKCSGNSQGFVFLGIQVSEHRFILSVDPVSGVYLKGLGDFIEQEETKKRQALGMQRQGENRPGYDSPDPWYDGRSPLHNYTIIDSPRAGTVLEKGEICSICSRYINVAQ